MMKQIFKKFGEKLKKKGIEVNVSVKIGEPKVEERKIIKPIYFEKEDK